MSVTPLRLNGWRGAGCGDQCLPRSHDPISHERYGYATAMAELRHVIVRTGSLTVNLSTRKVYVNDASVFLPGRELDVLIYLAERLGSFCSSEEIGIAIWGKQWTRPLAMTNVRANVSRLRRRSLGSVSSLISSRRVGAQAAYRLENVEPTS